MPHVVQYILVAYFIQNSLYHLIPFPYTTSPHFPLATGNHQFFLYIYESASFCFLFCSVFVFVLFCFVYGCTHGIWKFPGQGSNLNCSYDLLHSCGNTGSFNSLPVGQGLNPCLCSDISCYSKIPNPQYHSKNSPFYYSHWFVLFFRFHI